MASFERLPVLPAASNLAAVRLDSGRPMLLRAPRWLTSALDLPHSFPEEMGARHPLRPLAILARDLEANALALADLCLEVPAANGDTLILLVQGRFARRLEDLVPGAGPGSGAGFVLRDVSELVRARRQTAAVGAFHGLIGQSLPMLEVYHKIAIYGPTEAAVIITGETGTGKELIAKAIHERSNRSRGPFVAVNCLALTAELFESELFGHEKGAFTGAVRQHQGRFQRAHGGTLFLDEMGDMPLNTQAKMLRALEYGVVERVGGEQEEKVDVRVVAATNVALEQAVQLRRFRADLYHRISVLRIHVPPLRERHGDLPLLINYLLDTFNRKYGKTIRRVTPEALRLLEMYHWPGNVRELRNVMERLVIETHGEAISARALYPWLEEREYLQPGHWNADQVFSRSHPPIYAAGAPIVHPGPKENPPISPWHGRPAHDGATSGSVPLPHPDPEPPRSGDQFWGARPGGGVPQHRSLPLEARVIEAPFSPAPPRVPEPDPEPVELTREAIQEAYQRARGNLTRAARHLGVHKATLYRHMKNLGIGRSDLEQEARHGKES